MSKLTMCRGLPGSGKSTWARNEELTATTTTIRVNKDDIRKAFSAPWSYEQEKKVLETRDYLIASALEHGYDIISDDTNFAPKHKQRLQALAAEYNAEFVILQFDTPLSECIRRDILRPDGERVGEKVIMDMYNQFVAPKPFRQGATAQTTPERYVPSPELEDAIICDLDGTLAIHDGRSPYDFEKCDTDVVNSAVRSILWAMKRDTEDGGGEDFEVIYLSGRDDSVRQKTSKWIDDNDCPPGLLFMRKTGDTRNDAIVKGEIFDASIRKNYNVLFCLDDRDRVVKLWRDMGLVCLQVNYGNF